MKVVVLNVRSAVGITKRAMRALSICLLCVILFRTFAGVCVRSEEYAEAMCNAAERNTVIIDAGHGGEDCGAIGVNGVYEKDLNLKVAFLLGEILGQKGYAVVYTRTNDSLLYTPQENIHGIRKISDLKNRCKIGAEHDNALFVSIHMNSFQSNKYSGLQVYYSENNQQSYSLAKSVQNSVISNLQPENNRVVKSGKDIYLLKHLENTSILVECGFLTNEAECTKLCDKEYQQKLASFIADGIDEYLNKR